MSAFKPTGRKIHQVKVPTRSGHWVMRSTRTKDRLRAKAMQRMVDTLGPSDRGAWDLLELVTVEEPKTKKPRKTLPQLFDLWASTAITRHDPMGQPIAP